MLERELYLRSPGPGVAPWHNVGYADATSLRRVEILYHTSASDEDRDWVIRESVDNGRTWAPFRPIPDIVAETSRGGIARFLMPPRHDPNTGDSYQFTMVRHWPGRKCFDYSVIDGNWVWTEHVWVSRNGGAGTMLRYEDGPEYDPANPFDPGFFRTNTAYYSHLPAFGSGGEVYYSVCCYGRPRSTQRRICLFRRDPVTGAWRASNFAGISPECSSVGLEEPEVVRLKDGRLLIAARGQSTPTMSGVPWSSISTDDGKTLSPIEELRYDDGSRIHSPCSIQRFLRSTRNGRLYWVANILDAPATGQEPRYPLCIAEINEAKAAVIKESVRVIDDRRPGEPVRLQVSNFHIIEDRQSLNFEIYVTLLGLNPQDFWGSDVYRYLFSPPR